MKSALAAYKNMKEKDEKGEKPLYRDRKWKRKERKKEKRTKKETWYKKGGYETVMFIPATPKSELKKIYEKTIENSKVKVKVIEKRGQTLKDILQKSRPTEKRKCEEKEKCMVCKCNSKSECRKDNVTYKITCEKCNKIYIGETSKNAFTRGQQHERQLYNKDKQSVLYRHIQQDHQEEDLRPTFKMTVVKSHKSALCRQITEAILINNTPRDKLINNKTEWGHTKMMRTQMIYE